MGFPCSIVHVLYNIQLKKSFFFLFIHEQVYMVINDCTAIFMATWLEIIQHIYAYVIRNKDWIPIFVRSTYNVEDNAL